MNEPLFLQEISIVLKNENKCIGDINYIFCCDHYLLKINNKYLKKNFYTDVIAFDYSKGKFVSGDIFISIDRVLDNSSIWNYIFFYELKRVMIHALLHFLGYNDQKEEEKKIMKNKENFYLHLLKY
ncbi:rRNA maturation RNase YbeY [Blattabacterium cuenoti]|uniref:rRNA maturation RNase YbeY n=1 Tax=Blattabacterium cuenoti TaxID=1653831 RepID=UPI00293B9222|nr:rRNA maturation RNase YbeY [Blattabacterium cuenoti]